MRIRQLFESFDAPYEFFKVTKNMYVFDTEDGYEYDVLFHGKGTSDEPVEVMFVIVDKESRKPMRKYDSRLLANSAHPMRVLATVFAVAELYVRKYEPEQFTFSGERQLGTVYDRIISKRFRNSGYTIKKTVIGANIQFRFFKED